MFEKGKEFLSVFSKSTLETYEKLGIEVRKVPKSQVLGSIGGAIKPLLEEGKYALMKDGKEIFRGTKNEVDEIAEKLKGMSDEVAEKYLDELVETKKLDEFINNQNFKFLQLGYKLTHNQSILKDGTKEILFYLINKDGEKLWQGLSTISKDGILFNIFEVTLQQKEVSTAMYKLLDKIGFIKIEASYGSGTLGTNYKEFMKVYNKVIDNKVEAAFATPAAKAIMSALGDKFKPIDIVITEQKVKLYWVKK